MVSEPRIPWSQSGFEAVLAWQRFLWKSPVALNQGLLEIQKRWAAIVYHPIAGWTDASIAQAPGTSVALLEKTIQITYENFIVFQRCISDTIINHMEAGFRALFGAPSTQFAADVSPGAASAARTERTEIETQADDYLLKASEPVVEVQAAEIQTPEVKEMVHRAGAD